MITQTLISSSSGKRIKLIEYNFCNNPKFTVIESHGGLTHSATGTAEASKALIEMIEKASGDYLAIEFSNNGTYPDQPPEEALFSNRVKDLESTIDYVDRKSSGGIVLLGSSLGGYITSLCLRHSKSIKGVVLNCPALQAYKSVSRFVKPIGDKYDFTGHLLLKSFLDDFLCQNAYDALIKTTVPALIFHGDADKVTDIKYSRDAAAQNSLIKLVEVPGGGHRFDMGIGVWEKKVMDFIQSLSP